MYLYQKDCFGFQYSKGKHRKVNKSKLTTKNYFSSLKVVDWFLSWPEILTETMTTKNVERKRES